MAVSRSLGDHFAKDNETGLIAVPYICPLIELTETDTTLILASDGVR